MQLRIYSNRNIFMQGNSFQIIPALIDDDNSFNDIGYSDITYRILYGADNISILNESKLLFNMLSPGTIAIAITYNDGTNILYEIFYAQIIAANLILNKEKIYDILIQELVEDAYSIDKYDINGDQLALYTDNISTCEVIETLYKKIYQVFSQIYPENQYTPYWEFALNGTTNLFNGLKYAAKLLQLMNNINPQTSMTVWDIEYFLTQYIFYRTEISTLVYINDYSVNLSDYWILNISKLGVNTRLAPSNLENSDVQIVIFNNLPLQIQFEVTTLINRLIRPDINYSLTFTSADPSTYNLETVNYTYPFDSRLIYNKALKFTDNNFPFNIIGYTKSS